MSKKPKYSVIYNKNNILIKEEDVQKILKKFNIEAEIPNMEIVQQAFVHISYSTNRRKNKQYNDKYMLNENEDDELSDDESNYVQLFDKSNEVLEWYGDGIIQGIITLYLYERYHENNDITEHFFTDLRSKIVKTEGLSSLSRYLCLDKFLLISKHVEMECSGRSSPKILENLFEAFIGALYWNFKTKYGMAKSFDMMYKLLIGIVEAKINMTELIYNNDNYKGLLMNYYHKSFDGKYPTYYLDGEEKTDGERIFHMYTIDPDGNIVGRGHGKTKKEASSMAAKEALIYFGIIKPDKPVKKVIKKVVKKVDKKVDKTINKKQVHSTK